MFAIVCVILLLSVIQLLYAQDNCAEYIVTVEQTEYVRYADVSFTCSYNSTTETLIKWRKIDSWTTTESTFEDLYTDYPTMPDLSFPTAGYEDKVEGEFLNGDHVLTVHNASEADNFNYMRCVVATPNCNSGLDSTVDTKFADPQFAAVAMLIDGEVRTAEYESDGPVRVTCTAQSDPKAALSIADVATSQTCERLAGEPPTLWNCSVSDTLHKGEKDVSCRVTWNGVVQPSDTVRIKVLPTVAPTAATTSAAGAEIIDGAQAQTAASSSVIIGAVVAVVAVLIIAAVVGIIVYRKKKQGNTEDKGSLT